MTRLGSGPLQGFTLELGPPADRERTGRGALCQLVAVTEQDDDGMRMRFYEARVGELPMIEHLVRVLLWDYRQTREALERGPSVYDKAMEDGYQHLLEGVERIVADRERAKGEHPSRESWAGGEHFTWPDGEQMHWEAHPVARMLWRLVEHTPAEPAGGPSPSVAETPAGEAAPEPQQAEPPAPPSPGAGGGGPGTVWASMLRSGVFAATYDAVCDSCSKPIPTGTDCVQHLQPNGYASLAHPECAQREYERPGAYGSYDELRAKVAATGVDAPEDASYGELAKLLRQARSRQAALELDWDGAAVRTAKRDLKATCLDCGQRILRDQEYATHDKKRDKRRHLACWLAAVERGAA